MDSFCEPRGAGLRHFGIRLRAARTGLRNCSTGLKRFARRKFQAVHGMLPAIALSQPKPREAGLCPRSLVTGWWSLAATCTPKISSSSRQVTGHQVSQPIPREAGLDSRSLVWKWWSPAKKKRAFCWASLFRNQAPMFQDGASHFEN